MFIKYLIFNFLVFLTAYNLLQITSEFYNFFKNLEMIQELTEKDKVFNSLISVVYIACMNVLNRCIFALNTIENNFQLIQYHRF